MNEYNKSISRMYRIITVTILIVVALVILSTQKAEARIFKFEAYSSKTGLTYNCDKIIFNFLTNKQTCYIAGRSKGYVTVFEQTPFGNYEGDVVGGVAGFQTLDTGVITRDHMEYQTNGMCSSDWTVKTTKGWYPLVDLYRYTNNNL